MNYFLRRLTLIACASGLFVGFSWGQTQPTAAPTTLPSDPAWLADLAVKDIRNGDFNQGTTLLDRAAAMDSHLKTMALWADGYMAERKGFDSERHTQFEKAVSNIHLLLDHKMADFALDEVAKAYILADDKDKFTNEPWIKDLKSQAAANAVTEEQTGAWLGAMDTYVDLGVLEPASATWKDKFKLAMRRLVLLQTYTPQRWHSLKEAELKDRFAADALLNPATQPSAGAATTQPQLWGDDEDWHVSVQGIQFDMLLDSLERAEKEYYRKVYFTTLLNGGLAGIRTVLTTGGLEDAFPGLADKAKRDDFIKTIDACEADAKTANAADAEDVLIKSLDRLREANTQTVQLPEEVFVSEFANGAFAELDPFSTIIWPSEVEEFQKQTQGEFGGVGIQIQSEAGNLTVVSPLEDTPAYKAGVKAGDIITFINGKSAMGISVEKAVRTITGPPGTTVNLTIRSVNNKSKDYTIRREIIKIGSIKGYTRKPDHSWDYFVDPEMKVAYIRLTNFSKSTSEDLDKALDELKSEEARAIILDLRTNPGGLLQSATEVVNKFIPSGVIVSTRADRPTVNPPTVANARPEDQECDLPLIVLVNQYSASASEIVSGALKDHQRALIVGERTFGKGSVQMLFPLDSRVAYLKLTTSHYYLPSGRCIHREENSTTWGVDPDVTVEMTPEQMLKVGETRQQLDVISSNDDTQQPSTNPSKIVTGKDLLAVDPQLSAALLILREQLAQTDMSGAAADATGQH